MSKVSFEDIGMVTATFAAREDMKPGQVVKITGNGEVGACTDGDAFCGCPVGAERVRRGAGEGVRLSANLRHSDAGPGEAGRRRDRRREAVSTGGTEVLVVSADNSGHTAVVCL